MIHPCKLVTEAVKYPFSKIKTCPAVFICEAVLAEETFLPLSGDDSCFYSPLFLPYIFPQISRSCNSWRWGSHQLPPACTGHDSVLWHSPLQRRRSEMQEISVRQQKTKEGSTVTVLLQLRPNAGRDLRLLPKMQLLLWWLSCAGRSEGHHWVTPHKEESRSCFLPAQHCSACAASGPHSCEVGSAPSTQHHLPGLLAKLCARLQAGNPEGALVKPKWSPSMAVTVLSHCRTLSVKWWTWQGDTDNHKDPPNPTSFLWHDHCRETLPLLVMDKHGSSLSQAIKICDFYPK